MDGQEPHGIVQHRRRGLHAASLERAHKTVGRGKTATTECQRHTWQGAQIGQHRRALGCWRSGGEARQHVAVAVNGLQGVVWRQFVNPALPLKKNRP